MRRFNRVLCVSYQTTPRHVVVERCPSIEHVVNKDGRVSNITRNGTTRCEKKTAETVCFGQKRRLIDLGKGKTIFLPPPPPPLVSYHLNDSHGRRPSRNGRSDGVLVASPSGATRDSFAITHRGHLFCDWSVCAGALRCSFPVFFRPNTSAGLVLLSAFVQSNCIMPFAIAVRYSYSRLLDPSFWRLPGRCQEHQNSQINNDPLRCCLGAVRSLGSVRCLSLSFSLSFFLYDKGDHNRAGTGNSDELSPTRPHRNMHHVTTTIQSNKREKHKLHKRIAR